MRENDRRGIFDRVLLPRFAVSRGAGPIPVDTAGLVDLFRSAARGPIDAKRLAYLAGFGSLFLGVRSAVAVERRADDLLFPGYREQPVVTPTFIFANARSGTTLLHRLMSLDEDRFTAPRLHESILCTVTHHRAASFARRLDPLLGRPLGRLGEVIERRTMSGWDGIHRMGIDEPEEDESLFVYTLVAPGLLLLFPNIDEFPRARWLDRVEPELRRRIMAFYGDCIRRHVYAAGGNRTFLTKNIMLTGRLEATREEFPDARFIYLIRHPYKTIPSFLSMFYVPWSAHTDGIRRDGPEARALARLAIDYYRAALEFRKRCEASQFMVVTYRDLVADPRATVENVYAQFGLEISPAYRARLEAATAETRRYRSHHEYSLEEFGLSREEIHRELADVFDEFGFDP